MGGEKTMNRLLYGPPDPKALAIDASIDCKEIREECPECNGWGRIIYFADSGEKISEEDFRTKDYKEEIIIEKCEKCEGVGFINCYIEEPIF
jgi:RecJ-like exonuclease